MLDPEGQTLRARLLELFRAPPDEPLPDPEFDALAREIFAYQFERNRPYAAYCTRRGRTPGTVAHWTEIPAVPTAAFKAVPLVSGNPLDAEAVFRTSGTTLGPERRGEHHILDLSLYHAALLPSFRAYLLPDDATLTMISLVPPPTALPDSSLAHMIDTVLRRLGTPDSRYAASAAGLDLDTLDAALRTAESHGTPVCLLGTAAAFIHWLDRLATTGQHYRLPPGSRLMDTGGYKGRGRDVPEDELRRAYEDRLGIPTDHCVNEYGMTELCSQFYDNVLRDRLTRGTARPRHKRPPPWVRTRAADPETLEPLPPGEVGILRHYDLANLGSVLAVQTEDLGRETDDGGILVLGRALGAPPRGCSIAMDLLLRAAGRAGPPDPRPDTTPGHEQGP